ncbi:MAG: invasion associated locus B family protein [Xanthobacteraceae bacterium]|nr:invasion associated locus B family protein [Xanthobacteraceae bacterium]
MNLGLGLVPARPARHAARLTAATAMLAMAAATMSFAQAQQQPKQAPAKQAPKQQPKQQPPQPAQAPQQQPQQPQQAQQTPQQLPVIYSPWTKFCGKDQNNPQAKRVCLTVKEARLEDRPVPGRCGADRARRRAEEAVPHHAAARHAAAAGHARDRRPGAAATGALRGVACRTAACPTTRSTGRFVGKLKKGQQVTLQGINLPGQDASYPLPLGAEFAKASEARPPTRRSSRRAEEAAGGAAAPAEEAR